jgi:hypothetical protein
MTDRIPEKKKLVIAGPHGDERNAQRLIMAAQKYFIQHGAPENTVLYFIPSISPTMTFADARGIPIVDKNGRKYVSDDTRASINYALSHLTIPHLHNLLEERIPINSRLVLMREAIQKNIYNGIPFKMVNGRREEDDTFPKIGIDANRDIHMRLPTTQSFDTFMRSVTRHASPENILVIMVHGYYREGGVFGTYTVNSDETATLVPQAEKIAKAIWRYLFASDFVPFYEDTATAPLQYAGEWNQLLYNNGRNILSFDIELPGNFDEGRRGGNPSYNPNAVKEKFSGILILGKNSFFELLESAILW